LVSLQTTQHSLAAEHACKQCVRQLAQDNLVLEQLERIEEQQKRIEATQKNSFWSCWEIKHSPVSLIRGNHQLTQ